MTDKELRIGDAERTAAAQELGEHFAQGRLSAEEHQERLDRVMAARTASELTPLFADLPGSTYRATYEWPGAYAAAGGPGVGSDDGRDRPRGGRPYPAPPFGRPPFGRPPYRGRATRGWYGALPFPLKVLLVLLVAAVVVTHLPLILIGLVVWVLLARSHRWQACQRAGQRLDPRMGQRT